MSQLKFLLLEDSPLDAELIRATLTERGIDCELIQVKTRLEFQTAIKKGGFDLILADYALPDFDGITALGIAQNICPDIPFIFVTATLGEEVAIETLKNGATDYVLKQRLARLVPSVLRALREAEERRARKQAEAELHRREQEFRALAENSPDLIARFDTGLRHLYVNPAIERAIKIPNEAIAGKTAAELGFPEEVYVPLLERLKDAIATKEECFFEFEYPSPDGIRYFDVRIVPEFATDGSVQSLLSISRDITQHKLSQQALEASEAQLRKQTEKLEQANRIKDDFLAVLSHELRSPLNAILGWAKLLRTRQFDQATVTKAIETIERNAKLQTQLIEDLLDISRIIRGKLTLEPQPTSLVTAIAASIDTLRLAAEAKSIDLQFLINGEKKLGTGDWGLSKLPNTKFIVNGDASRLQQIVWNLLSNAIKFTPAGGRVEIELSTVTNYQLPITNYQLPITNYAQITIKDTGKGISGDFLPYVFETFRQADASITRQYGGLGLGLAIVRHLVELHGGTVSVESPGEGQGTTFTVQLPLLASKENKVEKGDNEDKEDKGEFPLAGKRVLVVDDEPDTQEFLVFTLEQYGATTCAVASVASALEVIPSFQPDLLLSDIGMPNEDGYNLIRKVRNLADKIATLPAVALTAYARSEDRIRALEAGFQTHVAKPIEPEELVTVVTNLLGSHVSKANC
ncbi:MAG TPA: hybrid sensor histidine kinase/response regulator [Cyanobacteria bacterium UBA11369]|nr:hybrid sensor histidine kinase/response regulator [Cyanobacteria bacterium UBA11371]HBE36561.1 hybrid sensor histidine kinase/response regulator [Cyanobacteria bacterium UBA11368]HBE49459.1 hybrid sensor histidine kinase/response regulator [Cyanobacteria bacterium UBA11369]